MSGRGRDSWRPAAPARNGDPRSSRLLSPPQVPDVYSFHGGDSYRPSPPDGPRRQARSQRGDFRFRSDVPASRFSRDDVAYNPMRTRRDLQFRHGDRASGPSNRPILRSSKEKTPEQFDGMTDGNARFKPLEDLSESENEMDISVASDNEESGPEAKRARISSVPTEEEAAKPKWSNPDPYSSTSTLLDAGPSKAKGVMQLIKKAKAASLKEDTKPIANNADFISFDDGDQSDDESSSESYSPTLKSRLASGSRGLEDPTGKQPPQAASFAATGGFTAINDNSATSAEASGGFAAINSNNATSAEAFSHSETYLRLNLTGYQPPVPNRKRKREEISGEVVQGWKGAESNNNPTPWVAEGLPELADVSLWLHKEICEFYDYMRPQGFEYSMREALLSRVAAALQACQPGQLFCFGSFASGLFLPNSDMDLVYLSDKFRTTGVRGFPEQTRFLHVMAASLRSHNLTTMQDTEVVGKARVPIIKFVERSTSLKVDISFENMAGVTAIRTFREWRILYPEMPVLVTVIKQFLAMRDLNEVFTGGLGGFTIICLVVSLLQNLPNGLGSQPSKGYNLGELLLEFFNLYGNKFDYLSTGITLDPPGYFAKSCPSNKLSIIDPNNSSNDISSGSHKVDLVFQCFKKAYNKLRKRINHIERYAHRYKDRKSTSILGFILGGDYRSIEWQRRRLRDLHFGRVQDRNIQPLNGNPPIPSGSTSSALNSVGSASSRKVHTFERSEYRTADVELLEEVGFVAVDKDEDMDESESIAPSDLSEDTLQMLSQSVFEVPPPPPPPVSSKKGKRYLPGKQRKSRGQPSGHNRHHSRGRGTTGSYGRGRGSHGYGSGNHGYGSGNHGHGGGNHGHGGGSHGYGSSSRGRGSGGRGRGSHGYGSGNHGHGGGIHGHGSSSRGHGSGARGRGEGGRGGSSRTHPRL